MGDGNLDERWQVHLFLASVFFFLVFFFIVLVCFCVVCGL